MRVNRSVAMGSRGAVVSGVGLPRRRCQRRWAPAARLPVALGSRDAVVSDAGLPRRATSAALAPATPLPAPPNAVTCRHRVDRGPFPRPRGGRRRASMQQASPPPAWPRWQSTGPVSRSKIQVPTIALRRRPRAGLNVDPELHTRHADESTSNSRINRTQARLRGDGGGGVTGGADRNHRGHPPSRS
jgi:hypothetical protein